MERKPGFKTVLLGDPSVGKSSLVMRFVHDRFSDSIEATVGAAFSTQTVTTKEERVVKFEIWDTAGQERFKSLVPMYYRGAASAIVVYDQSSEDTFQRAKEWVAELHREVAHKIVIALVANKMDLPPASRPAALKDEAISYAQAEGLLFVETSAKTGQGVHTMFEAIAERLPETPPKPMDVGGIRVQTAVTASDQKPGEKPKAGGCCSPS